MVDHCGSESPFPLWRFQKCLAADGKRMSEPRRLVAEKVFSWTGVFTADEVHKTLTAELSLACISRVSVHRTLSELTEFGLLRQVDTKEGFVYSAVDGNLEVSGD